MEHVHQFIPNPFVIVEDNQKLLEEFVFKPCLVKSGRIIIKYY
jgi:hypothetical protein